MTPRTLAATAFGVLLSISPSALGQEAVPFMETSRLVETCARGLKSDDTAARNSCETYLMGVFDAALAIQLETRRATPDSTFTVLCNPTTRPRIETLVENMVEQAENEPDSLKVEPAIYVIRTLNVPFSCK